jgi:mannose-6-phosphate isomerase-like protein (cupin superfamily)
MSMRRTAKQARVPPPQPNPSRRSALFPGAVGLTHLRVYTTQAPDGLYGGSPHMHFACTECYYVEKGHGKVQTLSAEGYQEADLEPGSIVWFSPGVIHRLINSDHLLEIFVVMQNAGLPEAGDFVLTMPPEILQDPLKYAASASLSAHGEVFAGSQEAAYRRRDLAVEGFLQLREEWDKKGEKALSAFFSQALPLVQSQVQAWQKVWRDGPLADVQMTEQRLKALLHGDISRLMSGSVHRLPPPGPERRLGMCGTLGTYLPEGMTVAEGVE